LLFENSKEPLCFQELDSLLEPLENFHVRSPENKFALIYKFSIRYFWKIVINKVFFKEEKLIIAKQVHLKIPPILFQTENL